MKEEEDDDGVDIDVENACDYNENYNEGSRPE